MENTESDTNGKSHAFPLRLDLLRNLYLFRNYGKDALLLSVLAYNVGPYRILGTKKIPKSRLLRKIERGDRNIYNDYIAFCRWHGRQVKSFKFLPCKRPKGLFSRYAL